MLDQCCIPELHPEPLLVFIALSTQDIVYVTCSFSQDQGRMSMLFTAISPTVDTIVLVITQAVFIE